MLSCENLYYRYARKAPWVLEDFSHDFSSGIHLIKGYSGCGKSTLLRILGGYLKPQKGKVVAVGPGTKDEKVTVKIGDSVLYGKYAGTELKLEGKDYLMMRESDILAIV